MAKPPILSTGQLVIKARPHEDDVVVRQKPGNPSTVYVLHTTSAPGQFLYRPRALAELQALAFAKHAHVAAWSTNDDDDFVLLGTFRKEQGDLTFNLARSS